MEDKQLRIQINHKSKKRGNPELYNLAVDIAETVNLAEQMPETVEDMTLVLMQAEKTDWQIMRNK